MSDSDSDLSTSNMNEFTFQNNNTIYTAHGPNMNDITSYSRARQISNNHVSSTIEMPARLGRPMFTDINYDQRSLYSARSRRGASPMSVMSACDFNNFKNRYQQRTIVNDRSRSPMSVRSIDSNTKENARDIAMRIHSSQFCPKDLKIIIEAINSYSKKNRRNSIEKRRKRRYKKINILKLPKNDLTSDSGGQASDSSISSIEGSIATSTKENMSSCRSTKTDIGGLKMKLQVNGMFNEHTNNLKQNYFSAEADGSVDLNITSVSSQNMAHSSMLSTKIIPDHVKFNKSHNSSNIMLLKDRFKSKFLLPSARFKKSSNSTSISEHSGMTSNSRNNLQNIFNHNNGMTQAINQTNGTKHSDSDADQYDIFSESISRQKNKNDAKRKDHEGYTSIFPNEKRAKVGVPSNVNNGNMESTSEESSNINKNATTNDFVFAKPQLPVGKSTKERLNNKSTLASKIHEESLITASHVQNSEQSILMGHDVSSDLSNVTQNSSDVSNKRKLFSQKLDMTEKKAMPVDSSSSPQDVYSIQKEKHKARKLQQVTTQSCLSRDFEQDDTNLVDLIHKIVPLEPRNKTKHTKNKTADNNSKWDVTSIISLNNSTEDVSDTYTDEEVLNATMKQIANENIPKKHTQAKITDCFKANNTKQPEDNVLKNQTQYKTAECKVVINTLPSVSSKLQQTNNGKSNESGNKNKYIQCFWDIDFESDIDSQPTHSKVESKQKMVKDAVQNIFRGFTSKNTKDTTIQPIASTSSIINNTSNNLQKFKYSTLPLRSYRQPTNKRYFEFGATDDTQSHNTNSRILDSSIETTNDKAKNNCQDNKSPETSQNKKKSPKNKRTASKINKTIDSVKALTNAQTKKNVKRQITDQNVKTSETKIEIKQKEPKRNNKKNNDQNNTNNLNTNNNDAIITKADANKKSTKKVVQNIKNAENGNSKNKQVTKDHNVTKTTLFKNKKVQNKEKDNTKSQKVPNKQKQSANISVLSTAKKSQKKICMTLRQNTSVNDNSIIEERKNRSLRTCRINKNLNQTNTTLNESFNMTLRSRRMDLSSSINGNSTSSKEKNDLKITKSRQCDKTNSKKKIDSKEAKSRVSEVSFSLPTKKCTYCD